MFIFILLTICNRFQHKDAACYCPLLFAACCGGGEGEDFSAGHLWQQSHKSVVVISSCTTRGQVYDVIIVWAKPNPAGAQKCAVSENADFV